MNEKNESGDNHQIDNLEKKIRTSLRLSSDFFNGGSFESNSDESEKIVKKYKYDSDYSFLEDEKNAYVPKEEGIFAKKKRKKKKEKKEKRGKKRKREEIENDESVASNQQLMLRSDTMYDNFSKSVALVNKRRRVLVQPKWHPPWKLYRVISGHLGWVNCIDVDVSNEFLVSGSNDRTLKIWDLATGKLRLTLPGHSSNIRACRISPRHPYLFSCGEDKAIKVWDLEQNKCIKAFHGHLSGVYTCDIHPHLDVVLTGGRDATVRIWDIRTKAQVYILTGHMKVVWDVKAQGVEPQVISGSADRTVRLWDLRKGGKTSVILTHHKKGIRSVSIHPVDYSFASAGADHIKKWLCPKGKFLGNFHINQYHHSEGKNFIVNSLCCNKEGVMVSGSNDGYLTFYDWKSQYAFQQERIKPQSGSLEAESGIQCCLFDRSGSRLITGEIDKTIKFWKEDESATPETHPVRITREMDESFF